MQQRRIREALASLLAEATALASELEVRIAAAWVLAPRLAAATVSTGELVWEVLKAEDWGPALALRSAAAAVLTQASAPRLEDPVELMLVSRLQWEALAASTQTLVLVLVAARV